MLLYSTRTLVGVEKELLEVEPLRSIDKELPGVLVHGAVHGDVAYPTTAKLFEQLHHPLHLARARNGEERARAPRG